MTTLIFGIAVVLLAAVAVPRLRDWLDRKIDELFDDLG